MFTRFLSTLPKQTLKRPPTDRKFLLKYDVENEKWFPTPLQSPYDVENDKWFPTQLQSYEEWPQELKDKVSKPVSPKNKD